jgi:arsenate reductase
MKKIYYLENCSTCKRIITELKPGKEVVMQDIKSMPLTPEQVDEMAKMAGSYEAIFSKIALKYRALKLNEKKLTEDDYRKYILQEYTFLKRPVIISGKQIFVGNAPKVVNLAKQAI